MGFSRKNNNENLEIIPKFKEKITLGQFILAGAFVILSISLLNLSLSNRTLASRPITNVQLADGTAILVQPKNSNYRDPKLIAEFTKQWVSLMFSWEGKRPGTKESDPGVEVLGAKVPINSWAASMMMEPSFAQSFLKELSEIIPSTIFNGRLKSAAIVRYDSAPRQINSTTWEIDIIADRIIFDENSRAQKQLIPFNKTFTIQAVTIPTSPLEQNANTLEKTIYKMRASGLEIISIVDYQP